MLTGDRLLRVVSGRTAGLLVFGFPPAGSGPSLFRRWLPHRPSGLELVAVHTPGREDRCAEPPATSIGPLADDIAAAIDRYADRPYVIFGHSAGALLGREVAWRLRQDRRPVAMLVAAGSAAPDVVFKDTLADADDDRLLDAVRQWGTPDDVLTDDALEVFLPCLRADMALAQACRRAEPPTALDRLDIPIVALTGREDRAAELHRRSWPAWTASATIVHVVPGSGHFLPFEKPAVVLGILAREAARLR